MSRGVLQPATQQSRWANSLRKPPGKDGMDKDLMKEGLDMLEGVESDSDSQEERPPTRGKMAQRQMNGKPGSVKKLPPPPKQDSSDSLDSEEEDVGLPQRYPSEKAKQQLMEDSEVPESEYFDENDDGDEGYCGSCDKDMDKRFLHACKHCRRMVCKECRYAHSNLMQKVCQDYFDKADVEINKFVTHEKELEAMIKSVEQRIDTSCDELVRAVDKRREALKNKVYGIVGGKKSELATLRGGVQEMEEVHGKCKEALLNWGTHVRKEHAAYIASKDLSIEPVEFEKLEEIESEFRMRLRILPIIRQFGIVGDKSGSGVDHSSVTSQSAVVKLEDVDLIVGFAVTPLDEIIVLKSGVPAKFYIYNDIGDKLGEKAAPHLDNQRIRNLAASSDTLYVCTWNNVMVFNSSLEYTRSLEYVNTQEIGTSSYSSLSGIGSYTSSYTSSLSSITSRSTPPPSSTSNTNFFHRVCVDNVGNVYCLCYNMRDIIVYHSTGRYRCSIQVEGYPIWGTISKNKTGKGIMYYAIDNTVAEYDPNGNLIEKYELTTDQTNRPIGAVRFMDIDELGNIFGIVQEGEQDSSNYVVSVFKPDGKRMTRFKVDGVDTYVSGTGSLSCGRLVVGTENGKLMYF